MKRDRTIVIGTRGSALALAQARLVLGALRRAAPALRFELRAIRTTGDRLYEASLRKIAGKGAFTKEIERALLDGRIDMAVHSLKDLPTALPAGLRLGAVPRREDPGDVFIGRDGPTPRRNGFGRAGGTPLGRLRAGSVVGTSSPRRQAQLLARYPRLRVEEIRGNLDTRLRKLGAAASPYAGIVLARAGLKRLGVRPRHVWAIPASVMAPAPGQGAIGVEIRDGDARTAALVARIHDARSGAEVAAERALLARLGGGCRLPLGARGEAPRGGRLRLTAVIATPDGRRLVRASAVGRRRDPEGLAARVHERLLSRGAAAVLRAALRQEARAKKGSRSPAGAGGRRPPPRTQVLFVCVENAGRSQMAEGFARALGLDAHSCGSKPAGRVNPLAVEAMREKGIDLSAHASKGFDAVPPADVVVTMRCGDACPYVPGRRFDWDLPDPKGKGLNAVRAIRDEIERRVRALAADLAGARPPEASP